MRIYKTILFLSAIFIGGCLFAQSESNIDGSILRKKERSFFLEFHSSGWGGGYRNGNFVTGYRKRMLEFEFATMKHPKEVKSVHPFYDNAKSFVYGKLNNLYLFRGGAGSQKVISSKPYWGGVEIRYFYYVGANVGITKPVYLYIINEGYTPYDIILSTERYDPDKHFISDIYGRGPFGKGFDKLGLHPGGYGKLGFNFEYGAFDETLRSLEVGATLDAFVKSIPVMANNPKSNFLINFYVSFHFGKRFN